MTVPAATASQKGRKPIRVKRLLQNAENSMNNAISYFFAHQGGSTGHEHCLLLLEHAFEMLFKAYVLEETGNILENRPYTYTYDFRECVFLSYPSSLPTNFPRSSRGLNPRPYTVRGVTKRYSTHVVKINGFNGDMLDNILMLTELRNMAQHYICVVSNDLLACVFYSSVIVFNELIKAAFPKHKREVIPTFESVPDFDMFEVLTTGIESIRVAGTDELKSAMLEVYANLDRYVSYHGTGSISHSISLLVRRLNNKTDWRVSFPYLHNLSFRRSGIGTKLYINKPVKAFVFNNEFPLSQSDVASNLGTNSNNVAKVRNWLTSTGSWKEYVHMSRSSNSHGHPTYFYSNDGVAILNALVAQHGSFSNLLKLAKKAGF